MLDIHKMYRCAWYTQQGCRFNRVHEHVRGHGTGGPVLAPDKEDSIRGCIPGTWLIVTVPEAQPGPCRRAAPSGRCFQHIPAACVKTRSLIPRRCRRPMRSRYSIRLFFTWVTILAVVTVSLTVTDSGLRSTKKITSCFSWSETFAFYLDYP